jgi:predicted MPP superfamily phosphohydrolase
MFFGIITIVLGTIHYYLWYRLVKGPELGAEWQRRGAWLFGALALLTPVGIGVGRLVNRPVAKLLGAVVYTWMGLSVLLFFALVASEVVRAVAYGAVLASSGSVDADRRRFLSRAIAGGAAIVGAVLAGAGVASALGKVALAKVTVPLKRLPKPLSGFRIVQLTDVHIGPTLGAGWLAGIVDRVNAAEPDVVVITGDLVDGRVVDLQHEVAPLGRLRAKHGVFFVTGNHEYYSGVEEWLEELARLGVRTLRNERVSIGEGEDSFDLCGVDDWSARRYGRGHGADLERALEGRDARRELVLLAHQPKQIDEAEKLGVGLQLSGHTHGGQIFPWGFFVRMDQPYVAGLARQGDTHIYVSRGTGFWGPPMRVGAPPEISVVELVAA